MNLFFVNIFLFYYRESLISPCSENAALPCRKALRCLSEVSLLQNLSNYQRGRQQDVHCHFCSFVLILSRER